MLSGKTKIIPLIDGLIKKTKKSIDKLYKMNQYFRKLYKDSDGNAKVRLDLSN